MRGEKKRKKKITRVQDRDTSAYGLGAILLQEGDINPQKPSKPRLHPIAYYSATFTPTERNYDIYERELLAVLKALQNWRPHLAWTPQPFTLIVTLLRALKARRWRRGFDY